MTSISIILPTCGRTTLSRAIDSVRGQLSDEDEVLIVGDGRQPFAQRTVMAYSDGRLSYHQHGPTAFFGNAQRNYATQRARGRMIAFLDDDDYYAATALADIRRAAAEHPNRPLMFKIQFHDPPVIKWREPVFADENISGGSFVVPNLPDRIAQWPTIAKSSTRFADRLFIEETLKLWPADSLVWRPEILYHVPKAGNNAP